MSNDRREYSIKPIETIYDGIRFRSRLEARWAITLDVIGCKWIYEKDGFDLDGERFLPDFFVRYDEDGGEPGWGQWIEIKPLPLNDREIKILAELAKMTGHRTYAICGNPWPGEHQVYIFQHWHGGEPKSIPLISDGEIIEIGTQVGDRELRIKSSGEDFCFVEPLWFQWGKVSLMDAFRAARQARFEHGESPNIPNRRNLKD